MGLRKRAAWRHALAIALLVALGWLCGCAPFGGASGARTGNRNMTPERLLATMTLEQKVGQLMVVSFAGTTFSAEAERMVRDYHVGGVILFQQNLVDAA